MKTCTYENCNKPARQQKLCFSHYTAQAPICSVEWCKNNQKARKYCSTHYTNFLKYGNPIPPEAPTKIERFMSFVAKDEDTGCWNWTGGQTGRANNRYGSFWDKETGCKSAHRWMYQYTNNVTLSYEPVHHKCGNGLCVNPDHLQLVTPKDNIAEMMERKFYKKRIAELEAEIARLKSSSCECAA